MNNRLWNKARRLSGLAKFERTCKRKTRFNNRIMLAYKVPGTQEAGKLNMLQRVCIDIYKRLLKEV